MTLTIIAFAGKRGSGKSEATKALVSAGFTELKFADPLKDMLRAMYRTCGLLDDEIERRIEGDLKEQADFWLSGKTPRFAMQTLGTEWRDLLDTNLWGAMFERRVLSGNFGEHIVCSDYRFPHEGEILRKLDAHIIRINRQNLVDDQYSLHASENQTDTLFAHIDIWNNGTIEELHAQANAQATAAIDDNRAAA